ncbi:MAG: NifU family protein [Sumerlaeia bacterium]
MPHTIEEQESKARKIIEDLRPYIQADGGDVVYDRLEDAVVYIELQGACVGCASSLMTLKMGIERRICDEIPEIQAVEMI